MGFEVNSHRSAGFRRRAGGAVLAVSLACAFLAPPTEVEASAAGGQQLPAVVAVMTASSGLAPELGLVLRIDAASLAASEERSKAEEASSPGSLLLGGIGGVLTLGLLVLAAVNSRKRWPAG